jgi:putative two-component system hydrogenase maturation factor HypX/HoxX
VYLYNATREKHLSGAPGTVIAKRHEAICMGTVDGAVWIGHMKPCGPPQHGYKLPATTVLLGRLADIPEISVDVTPQRNDHTYQDIFYTQANGVGYLHFEFYNGAMSTTQCKRLLTAYRFACAQETSVLVLMGGSDFWSNGLHLNVIEAAESPADESWENINAMNDLVKAIINTDNRLTIAALQGNAGAGGAFLALAADKVYARNSVVLNPHYKNMGNLFGSEYWTYLLPKCMGSANAEKLMDHRLPLSAAQAVAAGFIDANFGDTRAEFCQWVEKQANQLATHPDLSRFLAEKKSRRAADETEKPLSLYRQEELEKMRMNFYGFDSSYHVARYNFVYKVPHSWTPLYLARHRA